MGSTRFQDNGGICNDTTASVTARVPVMYNQDLITDRCVNDTVTNTADTSFGLYAETIREDTSLTSVSTRTAVTSSTTSVWGRKRPIVAVNLGGSGRITPREQYTGSVTIRNQ